MTNVVADRSTSGVVTVCSPSTCSTTAFHALGNGIVSVSSVYTVDVADGFGASINIDSMPAGATFNIGNFVVNSIPTISETGIVRVCDNGGVGTGLGMPFSFNVQQFTVAAPPISR